MQVSEAVFARRSIRHFTDQPVNADLIAALLTAAGHAPSGGNLQPWHVFVVSGESMERFRAMIADHQPGPTEYEIYPPGLQEPYRSRRFAVGEAMYDSIGVPRDDKPARRQQFAKNQNFFGAPVGLFCFVDRRFGPPQWSDLGMFLQSLMLLAVEAGLSTCAQEFWATLHQPVQEFVGAPEELMLFCGVAVGYGDDHPINEFEVERAPLAEWATFVE